MDALSLCGIWIGCEQSVDRGTRSDAEKKEKRKKLHRGMRGIFGPCNLPTGGLRCIKEHLAKIRPQSARSLSLEHSPEAFDTAHKKSFAANSRFILNWWRSIEEALLRKQLLTGSRSL